MTSDADVAVLPGGHLGLLDRERLAMRLAEALEVAEVDLVALDEAKLELRGRVVVEGKVLFSDDELSANEACPVVDAGRVRDLLQLLAGTT